MGTETTWSEFPNGEKNTVEQIPGSDGKNTGKQAGVWE